MIEEKEGKPVRVDTSVVVKGATLPQPTEPPKKKLVHERKKKKAKKKKVGKPNRFLFGIAMTILKPWYRLRYGLRIDRSGLAGLKGPALILAPHISKNDHLLVGMTLSSYRPTYVLSAHYMARPLFRGVLKLLHVITKRMFCADAHTIMDILRAKNEGNITVLFPEGRLPACGHSMPVAPGTADLVKKLGIDVYTITSNGAYLTFPKWAKKSRHGKINIVTSKLFDKEELRELSVSEVDARIASAMHHNDEASMPSVKYRCHDTTAGLDGILRRCPQCGAYATLVTKRSSIRCTACGMNAMLDNTYVLHGAPFQRINEWFDWQQRQIDPYDIVLESDMTVGAVDERGNLKDRAGFGHARMDAKTFDFAGEVFGKTVAFSLPTAQIGGFPVTVADHFDIYSSNVLYQLYPEPDRRAAIDWVSYLDRYHALLAELPSDESKAGAKKKLTHTQAEEMTGKKEDSVEVDAAQDGEIDVKNQNDENRDD